jgi:hypothetical protein
MSGRSLTVRFAGCKSYTLTANFTLPNGSTHSTSKTVSVVPGFSVAVASPPTSVTYAVTNPTPGVKYEWEINNTVYTDRLPYRTSVMTIDSTPAVYFTGDNLQLSGPAPTNEARSSMQRLAVTPTRGALYLGVRCRALENGTASAWTEVNYSQIWQD